MSILLSLSPLYTDAPSTMAPANQSLHAPPPPAFFSSVFLQFFLMFCFGFVLFFSAVYSETSGGTQCQLGAKWKRGGNMASQCQFDVTEQSVHATMPEDKIVNMQHPAQIVLHTLCGALRVRKQGCVLVAEFCTQLLLVTEGFMRRGINENVFLVHFFQCFCQSFSFFFFIVKGQPST